MEAHHPVNGPDTGRNSAGRQIKKVAKIDLVISIFLKGSTI